MRVAGSDGALLAGGRVAASLGAWQAESGGGGWSIEAAVTAVDGYWLEHAGAYTLRLEAGRRAFVWRGLAAAGVAGTRLRLVGLGEPEGVKYG